MTRTEPDRDIGADAQEICQALLRIDTTNPPGNETAAAQYVKTVLDQEGIQTVLLGPDKARLNLVARIRGREDDENPDFRLASEYLRLGM